MQRPLWRGFQPAAPQEPLPAPAASRSPATGGSHGSAQPDAAAGAAPTALPRAAAPDSNNARIHPRSKYAFEAPHFEALAARYPSLQPYLLRGGGGGARAGSGPCASASPEAGASEAADSKAAAGPGGGSSAGGGGRPSIDFSDPAACRELTRVLLLADFGVEWWVPLGQLVPPLTNRANYIHWLEDLLALSAPSGECT